MDSSPEIIDGVGDVYHCSGAMWREGYGKTRSEIGHISMRSIFSPCAAAALYRREAFLEVGGFDEDFFCYCEDVDLGFRLRLAGCESVFVPDAVVRHAVSSSSGGERSDFATYHGHRNMVWVFIKNMPSFLFWLFLPLHVAMNIAAVFILAARGQGLIALKAKWDAIKGIPKMWQKRQQIQATRKASTWQIWRAMSLR
jgi:GT2 family glycosyltransferase